MPSTVVAAGANDVTINGAFGSLYDVFLSANWATELPWARSTDSFLVSFTTQAPAVAADGGPARLTYMVVGATSPGPPSPGASTLTSYLADVRRFLHARAPGDQLYNDTDLTAFINRAMQQRDLDLGLNRSLVSFNMVTGQARYLIASIIAGGAVIDGSTSPNPIDVISIYYTPQGSTPPGGGIRVPLGRWPYSRLSFLVSRSFPSLPRWYAVYGTGSIVVGPIPAGNYYAEWDFYCYASPLVNPLDADPLGYPWTDPVPFMAASFAKDQAQRYDEAKEWAVLYADRLNRVRARGRPMSVANPYADYPGAYR